MVETERAMTKKDKYKNKKEKQLHQFYYLWDEIKKWLKFTHGSNFWNKKRVAIYDLNKFNEAIKVYDKAIEITPGYSDVWKIKGIVLDSLI